MILSRKAEIAFFVESKKLFGVSVERKYSSK